MLGMVEDPNIVQLEGNFALEWVRVVAFLALVGLLVSVSIRFIRRKAIKRKLQAEKEQELEDKQDGWG